MARKKVVPQGYHTITPNLVVNDAAQALEFYKKALGAEETVRMPGPNGRIMHAEMRIGDSVVMLGEERPDMGRKSPSSYGGSPVGFYVYVENLDAAWNRAVGAGAKATRPPADMFWGDRTGTLEDPFGHSWSLAEHVKDPTPEEIKRGEEEFFAQAQKSS
jgi:PhnB protein